jgi:hypothetical protein
MLKIQIGSATDVILEAIPETTCPSQIMTSPFIPFGRGKEKSGFLIAEWIQHNTANHRRQPLIRRVF